MSRLHLPAGSVSHDRDPVRISPERAGWRYTGLDVVRLQPGERRLFDTIGRELVVLPLSGSCVVDIGEDRIELHGRRDVFAAISDFAYVPAGGDVALTSRAGGEFALPWALATQRFAPAYGAASTVRIEARGAGRATRQINNFFTHDAGDAERLVAVEVLTPPGNWSSWPPHKHDDATVGTEDELEEIYYFRIQGENGFGIHRTYTSSVSSALSVVNAVLDETVVVRDGDVFLVPCGYHGPCIAAPEFAMYYLNVLAGPGTTRTLRFSDDPAYAWVRDDWKTQEPDPRVPLTTHTRVEVRA
ncbi:MAG: 5-deoxy-glucuronate isomerase [Longimicrobiales bacterium]